MSALKQQRRSWSKEKKLAMLTEALDTSISAVARKYDIRPALLFVWRRQLNIDVQNQSSISNISKSSSTTSLPTLQNEYKKLIKIQSALSAKLKRDLLNDTISSYAAGSTLINLYNGMTKLEALQNEMPDELDSQRPNQLSKGNQVITLEAQSRQREIQRMAERALVELEKYRIERNNLEVADSQGQANA
jgi:transposase-like protein